MDIRGSVKAVGIVFAMMFASILAGSGFGIAGTQHAEIQAQVPVPPFRIGMLQPIASLNPFAALTSTDYTVFSLIYSRLTSWDQDWNPAPELAISWRVLSWKAVDDPGTPQDEGANRLWQYDIRQGVTCTDGVPLTAADVAWTLNFDLDTNPICWAFTPYIPLNVFDHAEVNATLPNSVDLFLKVPSVLIDTMSIPIVPEHIFGSMSRQQVLKWDGLPPVGSGPFEFVEYVTGSHVTMVANDQYYFGKPHIETLQFFWYANDQVMAEALKKGDIDVAQFPAAQTYNTLKGFSNIDTAEVAYNYMKDVGFNCYPDAPTTGQHPVNPLVRDERVHQALHYATNKQYLLDLVFGGYGQVGAGLIQLPARYYYDPGPDTFNFDLDKANETLEAAGYVWNGDHTVRVAGSGNPFAPEGTPLEFEMLVINTAPEDVAMAPYLVGWWGIVGVKVTIVYVDDATMETRVYWDANHEIYIWYWDPPPDPRYILEVQTTSEVWGWSDNFWSNETFDELFLLQMQQTGEERNATIQEMCRINYLSSPFIWIVYPDLMLAWRTDVWTGWGDVAAHVGLSYVNNYQPNAMLFGVMPIGENMPPYNVDAGSDTLAVLGETKSFTGSAEDPNDDVSTLNWTWKFSEPGGAVNYSWGRTVMYTFLSEGTVIVTLTVRDPGGLSAQDIITVTVQLVENVGWLVGYVKNGEGVPIVAALVTADGSSATANDTGFYKITLAEGSYDVVAEAAGYGNESLNCTILADESTWLNFSLNSTSGSLSGYVRDADTSAAIAGAYITVQLGDSTKSAVSNSTGGYRISLLEAGTYEVNVAKTGYETNTTSVTIVVGQEKLLDIELKPVSAGGGGVSGTVLAAIAVVVIVVVVAAVALMLLRRKKAGPDLGERKTQGPEQKPET